MAAIAQGTQFLAAAAGLTAVLVTAIPSQAQQATFDALTLTAGGSASASGFTTGLFALSNIAGRDRNGTICTGFADTAPNHILVLEQDFASLTLQVNSGGNDTSLLVQGPDGSVRCGEDTDRRNPDARLQDQGWGSGTYRVWVGSHNQGQRYNYSLTASP
jgi:hypothetical protein